MASTLALLVSFVIVVVSISSQLPNICFVEGSQYGDFSIELIHCHSPLSPFYNSSDSNGDRVRDLVHRSISRIQHFSPSSVTPNTLESQVIPNGGSYLMKVSIGSPPVNFFATADTGSDLIWSQCKPCYQCYAQDSPVFDPKESSTYKESETSCESTFCQALPRSRCGNTGSNCKYVYSYGDHSHSIGVLATDTFTFDSNENTPTAIPDIVFGCGHNNAGTFNSHGSGLIGLGGGPLSLISQLGSQIDGKFSYCLVPIFDNATSKLNFGQQAIIASEAVVSTPLVEKDPKTFYYLTLEGISVGDKKVEAKFTSLIQSEGNIIIDSGTTLTILDGDLYNELESALKGAIEFDTAEDPSGTFGLCYNAGSDLNIPTITFHFTGADLQLNSLNTFIKASDDLVCLAMIPNNQGTSIFGNIAHMNFQVEYDLAGRKVSFAPADCSKN
ncbi:hypothetical protein GIB67_023069 [Kingdonia uniflora]|uniref:Peptidase A1 domain-containing protein n=1 Tax=Kingdonia uniflora TaxID=39325 RepID=A0A7J7P7Y9_9MAGN|nr:hypothetical protein GIB67_023069 [Kingdonia uniflora]